MRRLPSEGYFTEPQRRRWSDFDFLTLDVWHQRHKPCPLDSTRKIALRLGCQAAAAATEHTRVWVDVVVQTGDVLVVDVVWVRTLFCFGFHDGFC